MGKAMPKETRKNRRKLPSGEIYGTPREAKVLIEGWRREYKRFRPGSYLRISIKMNQNRTIFFFGTVAALLLHIASGSSRADERLEGIACRSVHLQYTAPESIAFYNEVTVGKSSEGTYFCVCGFNRGYYGIQELRGGRKLLIFSVWDPGRQDNPDAVREERRVKVLQRASDVRVRRFGNEGTGGQSFFDYDWKVGETYRFLVTAERHGERTDFTAYFYIPEKKEWKRLVTFSTLAGGRLLRGHYSFVEDFRRNRVSATKARRARFGNGWVRTPGGRWVELARARFTADRNPVTNIDAGVAERRFFLATGGETRNTHTKLWQHAERPVSAAKDSPGPGLPPRERRF